MTESGESQLIKHRRTAQDGNGRKHTLLLLITYPTTGGKGRERRLARQPLLEWVPAERVWGTREGHH